MVGSWLVSINVMSTSRRPVFSEFYSGRTRAGFGGQELQRRTTGISLLLAMRTVHVLVLLAILSVAGGAASKPHVVSLGKPLPVKVSIGAAETRTMDILVAPLFVDT